MWFSRCNVLCLHLNHVYGCWSSLRKRNILHFRNDLRCFEILLSKDLSVCLMYDFWQVPQNNWSIIFIGFEFVFFNFFLLRIICFEWKCYVNSKVFYLNFSIFFHIFIEFNIIYCWHTEKLYFHIIQILA